jgi:hypothetical protein
MTCIVIDPYQITQDDQMPFLEEVICPDKVKQNFQNNLDLITNKHQLLAINVIRYKPQKRCLIEYHFQAEKPLVLIGKIRAKGTDIKSYKIQKQLWENDFNDHSSDRICVPEPLGVIPQWHMWVQKKVLGKVAFSGLSTNKGIEISRKIAHVAHKLHQVNLPCDRLHTITEELNILEQKLPQLCQDYPHWHSRIESLLNKCQTLAKIVTEHSLIGIHRDFYGDQIIIHNNYFYLLDLDLYCQGNPCLDIGNFIAHITEYSLRKFGKFDALKDREDNLTTEFLKLNIADENNYFTSSDRQEKIKTINREITIYKILTLVQMGVNKMPVKN